MNRRTYLTTAAAIATGGCLSDQMTDPSSNGKRKTVAASNVERRTPADVETVDREEQPDGLGFDVDVIDERIGSDSTARIALVYENAGDRTLRLNLNPEHPRPVHATESSPGLLLLSDGITVTPASEDCWKPADEEFPQFKVAHQHPIEPGEQVRLAYDVWASPRQQPDCIQTASYRLEPLYGAFSLIVSESS